MKPGDAIRSLNPRRDGRRGRVVLLKPPLSVLVQWQDGRMETVPIGSVEIEPSKEEP